MLVEIVLCVEEHKRGQKDWEKARGCIKEVGRRGKGKGRKASCRVRKERWVHKDGQHEGWARWETGCCLFRIVQFKQRRIQVIMSDKSELRQGGRGQEESE